MLLAAGGWPRLDQVFWITVAMAAARTLAMSMNRLADQEYDARNPRTANRPLPRGLLRPETLRWAVGVSGVILVIAAWALNPLCVALLPVALLFLIGYHYTKRFTWLSHWILGFTDGLAPMGAWIALRGSFWKPEDLPAWIRLNHLGMLLLLAGLGLGLRLGWPYGLGLAGVAALLVYEHRLVSPQDLSRVDVAFFNVNAYISVLLFAATWGGLAWGRW
jgi:4-hydroxybenzoate polyprenyltransferase